MQRHPSRNQDDTPRGSAPPYGPYQSCHVGGPLVYPGCGRPVKAICDMDQIGKIERAVSPQATWSVTLGPKRAEYFQVLAARMVVSGNTDPTLNGRLFMQNMKVNDKPIKGWVNGSPGLTNTSGIWTDQYIAPDGYGIPEPGYIVSQENLTQKLELGGVSFEPTAGGLTLDVAFTGWGNGLSECPAGFREFAVA